MEWFDALMQLLGLVAVTAAIVAVTEGFLLWHLKKFESPLYWPVHLVMNAAMAPTNMPIRTKAYYNCSLRLTRCLMPQLHVNYRKKFVMVIHKSCHWTNFKRNSALFCPNKEKKSHNN